MLGRVVRKARAFLLGAVCLGGVTGAAQAATLNVGVSPGTIHKGDTYSITLTGKFRKSELTGRAYLISLIQFSRAPCRATAQLENKDVSASLIEFYFRPSRTSSRVGISPKSPFTRTDAFTAKSRSTRRVCAYLYPQVIGPADTTVPIATASAKYTVLK